MMKMNKQDLHSLVRDKCHRVPLYDTIKELKNPTGILTEEYSRIMKRYERIRRKIPVFKIFYLLKNMIKKPLLQSKRNFVIIRENIIPMKLYIIKHIIQINSNE